MPMSISACLRYAAPQAFYALAGRLVPWFAVAAAIAAAAGLYVALFVAPTDAQQGEGYRIIFLHVPTSWMSMFIYVVMACWAAVGMAFNTRLSSMVALALAPSADDTRFTATTPRGARRRFRAESASLVSRW